MTVWVVVVSARIGDREGFVAADRVAVGSSVGVGSSVRVGSSVGRLDESAGLGSLGVGLGISGRVADLVGVGRDTVGVGSGLAERDGDSGTSMVPPPAHEVSTAKTKATPAIFMTSVPTLPPDPALLPTPTPDTSSTETRYGPAGPQYPRQIVASFGLSHVETEVPATHVRHELTGAGMFIMADGDTSVSKPEHNSAASRSPDTFELGRSEIADCRGRRCARTQPPSPRPLGNRSPIAPFVEDTTAAAMPYTFAGGAIGKFGWGPGSPAAVRLSSIRASSSP